MGVSTAQLAKIKNIEKTEPRHLLNDHKIIYNYPRLLHDYILNDLVAQLDRAAPS